MLEKIIFKHLYNYLQEYEILTRYQSGFRPRDSTVNQLLEIYHIIIENLDKGKNIKFIFCDVSKAFDKVWHDGLLFKLKKYGIQGNLLEWFTSYLSDRKQRVYNEGFYSTWADTLAGVPQGSVLGPYLFLLYVNDIVDNIQSNIRLFADDTSLFAVIDDNNSTQILTEDLHKIASWADDWCIILNPSKTKSMTFTRQRHNSANDIQFNNYIIKDESTHTHLGLTFTSDATWGNQINNVYERACTRLNIMSMLKHDLDRNSLSRFYLTFIRPVMEYGSIIWDGCTKAQSDLLENLQLYAARIVTGLRRGTSHSILYKETGWKPLSERRKDAKLIYFYKILNNEAPTYITEILDAYNIHQSDYNLRSQSLRYPTPRTTAFRNSYFPSTIEAWNKLDPTLNNATSLFSFKKILKNRTIKPPKHFSYGSRSNNIIMCQLRNSKSQLNLDLFNDHLSDSSECACGAARESVCHYLLECPLYAGYRYQLINNLMSKPLVYAEISITIENLLHGNPSLSYFNNCFVFDCVASYIVKTNRFNLIH